MVQKMLQKSFIERKEFDYKKGIVGLNFALRIDNSSELKDFKSLLDEAIKDIDKILKGMKN